MRRGAALSTSKVVRSGAREVIVVGLKGEVENYGPEGLRSSSALGIALALAAAPF
jgi:hypothetical protein